MKTMRAFAYSKVTSKKIATIENVISVRPEGDHKIVFQTTENETFTFDTREVKTTTYQN